MFVLVVAYVADELLDLGRRRPDAGITTTGTRPPLKNGAFSVGKLWAVRA